jgi:hypothetical protein
MARVMAIPMKDHGQAVLIVTRDGSATLMGFVAVAALCACVKYPLSTCECVALVERHLTLFETILIRKSSEGAFVGSSIACVEIEPADLADSGLADLHQT